MRRKKERTVHIPTHDSSAAFLKPEPVAYNADLQSSEACYSVRSQLLPTFEMMDLDTRYELDPVRPVDPLPLFLNQLGYLAAFV